MLCQGVEDESDGGMTTVVNLKSNQSLTVIKQLSSLLYIGSDYNSQRDPKIIEIYKIASPCDKRFLSC